MKPFSIAIALAGALFANQGLAQQINYPQAKIDGSTIMIHGKLVTQETITVPQTASEILSGSEVQQGSLSAQAIEPALREPGLSAEAHRTIFLRTKQQGIVNDQAVNPNASTTATSRREPELIKAPINWGKKQVEQSYVRGQVQSPQGLFHQGTVPKQLWVSEKHASLTPKYSKANTLRPALNLRPALTQQQGERGTLVESAAPALEAFPLEQTTTQATAQTETARRALAGGTTTSQQTITLSETRTAGTGAAGTAVTAGNATASVALVQSQSASSGTPRKAAGQKAAAQKTVGQYRANAFLLFLPLLLAPIVFFLFNRFFSRSTHESFELDSEADAIFLDSYAAKNDHRDAGFSNLAADESFAAEDIDGEFEVEEEFAAEDRVEFTERETSERETSEESGYRVTKVSEYQETTLQSQPGNGFDTREGLEVHDALGENSAQRQSLETRGSATSEELNLKSEVTEESFGHGTTAGSRSNGKSYERETQSATSESNGTLATSRQSNKVDDLTKITGIGPATSKLLNNAGIWNFQDLAQEPLIELEAIVAGGGPKFKLIDPTTWSTQAAFAGRNDWLGLKNWIDAYRQKSQAGLPQSKTETVNATECQPTAAGGAREDDLTLIRGIGSATRKLLNDKGIYTFRQVAVMSGLQLIDLLHNADASFELKDPQTWPTQARELLEMTEAEMERDVLEQIQDLSSSAREALEAKESASTNQRQSQEA